MTPQQLVHIAKAERDRFFTNCFDPASGSLAALKVAASHLDAERMGIMREAIGNLLTDVFYTWLLALDGCANFGGEQHDCLLADEDGSPLSGGGEIEAEAWKVFNGERGRKSCIL